MPNFDLFETKQITVQFSSVRSLVKILLLENATSLKKIGTFGLVTFLQSKQGNLGLFSTFLSSSKSFSTTQQMQCACSQVLASVHPWCIMDANYKCCQILARLFGHLNLNLKM